MMAPENRGGYVHYMEKVDGQNIRGRSDSFKDFYSQATLFWNSMSPSEKKRIVEAFHFELGKVMTKEIRERMVEHLTQIDEQLANEVARGLGIQMPIGTSRIEQIPDVKKAMEIRREKAHQITHSPALSMENTRKDSIRGRKVAILLDDGFDYQAVQRLREALKEGHAKAHIISKFHGMKKSSSGEEIETDQSHVTAASVLYDAVFIPGGKQHIEALMQQGDALHFINEAYKHYKPVGATGAGADLLRKAGWPDAKLAAAPSEGVVNEAGVVTLCDMDQLDDYIGAFTHALAHHRHWERGSVEHIPA